MYPAMGIETLTKSLLVIWISPIQAESPTIKVDFEFQLVTPYIPHIKCFHLKIKIDFESRTFVLDWRNSFTIAINFKQLKIQKSLHITWYHENNLPSRSTFIKSKSIMSIYDMSFLVFIFYIWSFFRAPPFDQ